MSIILDTHVWWWAVSEPDKLSERVREKINVVSASQRFAASISLWEFVMMTVKGRISLAISPSEWFAHTIKAGYLGILPLTADIAIEACRLPGNFHKDPADRIITATARKYNALLITKDRKILEYPGVKSLW